MAARTHSMAHHMILGLLIISLTIVEGGDRQLCFFRSTRPPALLRKTRRRDTGRHRCAHLKPSTRKKRHVAHMLSDWAKLLWNPTRKGAISVTPQNRYKET